MIEEVTYEKSTWAVLPNKFEAGTPNIAGAIGLAAGIKFVESIGWDEIVKHEADLSDYLHQELSKIDGLQIYGKTSFTVNDIHPHDMAEILNSVGVAVRAGHHCAMPLMKHLGIHGTTRASLGIYNSKEGIDQLVLGINGAKALFGLKKAEDIVKDSGLHQQYMDQA